MPRKRALILALAFALVGAVFAVASVLRVPRQSNSLAQHERADETVTPIVDFNAPTPADPREKALRRSRSKLYDYAGDPTDAKKFSLTEGSEPVLLDLPISDGPKESPIPVQQADAVVIGIIIDARAYLSNDKTNVYSEFTTSLVDVLLNDRSASLYAGAVITTSRRGGTVKLPSGKTLVRGALGRTMPQIGNRYLLFLRKNEEGQTFSIITGYELRNGKVIPLDGLSKKTPQFSQYAAYENADETTLLNQVRESISQEGSKVK
jgi:HAMP domain-containing protein